MTNSLVFTTKTIRVEATNSWTTVATIPANISVTITYESGTWTADPHVTPATYDANGNLYIQVPLQQTSYPIPGANAGSLVGRLGASNSAVPFLIGDGPFTIIAGAGGDLQLCINDDLTNEYGKGLQDNSGSVVVKIFQSNNMNTRPDTSKPLLIDPAQTKPLVDPSTLGPLQHLIGTWTNQNINETHLGGPQAPYSYNVMPLPQVDPSSPSGFILKNFAYYEELTFSAIHGNAPNRGGIGQQVAFTIFYEQRVYFAEGPNKDALVHAENGSLLYLVGQKQPLGPYGDGDTFGLGTMHVANSIAPNQPADVAFVKQVSVPHGNSILALGSQSSGHGAPSIESVSVLPSNTTTLPSQYTTRDPVTNPNPMYTADPNQVLRDALKIKTPSNYINLNLSSANGAGAVTNIGFEQQHAKVNQYDVDYWLESFDGTNYTQLQYSQTIEMLMPFRVEETIEMVTFPHVTVNTLTKVI